MATESTTVQSVVFRQWERRLAALTAAEDNLFGDLQWLGEAASRWLEEVEVIYSAQDLKANRILSTGWFYANGTFFCLVQNMHKVVRSSENPGVKNELFRTPAVFRTLFSIVERNNPSALAVRYGVEL